MLHQAGFLTKSLSSRPSLHTEVTMQWADIRRHYSSWNCPGFAPDSLSSVMSCRFT
jgi:hypothetical protein